ncbi:MAG TPA: aminodeoxychorismate/anthranilate synthase component II [Thermoplasmata archaeon]|nr:aminodeoxychorismate/anthranilate synthase component II [Thermoplasmata archaeon]
MKVLLIDHEDSFVYNIAQALAAEGAKVVCLRATRPLRDALKVDPDAVVLSPGPGHPSDLRVTGLSRALLERWEGERPFLGVCLGHQLIGEFYGGRVALAPAPVHGDTSLVEHDGRGLFRGVRSPLVGARYHSLVVASRGIPDSLEVTAHDDAGLVMGLRHRRHSVESVQFHPESYLTPTGPRLLENFLAGVRR